VIPILQLCGAVLSRTGLVQPGAPAHDGNARNATCRRTGSSMRILNETRTVILSSTPARIVEARVRVRGVDVGTALPRAVRARMGVAEEGRRFHLKRQEPVEVIVRGHDGERTHRLGGPSGAGMAALAIAMPLVATAITRLFRPKRSN